MEKKAKVPKLRFPGFTGDWEQRKLGEITDSYSGGTPSVGVKEYYGGDIPFIRSAEINSNKTELSITPKGLKNSSARMVNIGDILYALYGATSGEVGLASLKGAVNQAVLVIQPHDEYCPEFLMQWLRKSKQNIIDTYLQGGQGNLSGMIVKSLVIDCPSQEEQKQIGAYFKSFDNLITLHQRKLTHLQAKKKSLLQKMFPKKGERFPELRFPGFTDAWEQRKFGEIVATRRGLTYSPSDICENGVRVLRSSNINGDTFQVSPDDVFVNREAVNIEYASENDILITSANGSSRLVGKHALMLNISDKSTVHGGFMLLATAKEPNFINASMSSDWYKKFIDMYVSGGNGAIGNLSKLDLDSQIIYVPSQLEQKQVGAFFKKLDNLITLHQRKLAHLQTQKKALLQQMFV